LKQQGAKPMKLQSDLLNIRLPHLLKFHLPKSFCWRLADSVCV